MFDERTLVDETEKFVEDFNAVKGYAFGKIAGEGSIGDISAEDVTVMLTSIRALESYNRIMVKQAKMLETLDRRSKELVDYNESLTRRLNFIESKIETLDGRVKNPSKKGEA